MTRKITNAVAKIKLGLTNQLKLGNLDAQRDWGYAPEYVRAMWLMLQQDAPDDYVIATGEAHSVREFVTRAFEVVNLDWRDYVVLEEQLYRPAEVFELKGDARKAEKCLGWTPQVIFDRLVEIMVEKDLEGLQKSLGVPAQMKSTA